MVVFAVTEHRAETYCKGNVVVCGEGTPHALHVPAEPRVDEEPADQFRAY